MTDSNEQKSQDGGKAVGAYLRYLREAQGLQANDVAEQIGSNQTQLWRIENWRSDTRGTLLFRLIRAVGGDANDIELLINNPDATPQDGETLAKLRLSVKTK